jgi:hypothetical protein
MAADPIPDRPGGARESTKAAAPEGVARRPLRMTSPADAGEGERATWGRAGEPRREREAREVYRGDGRIFLGAGARIRTARWRMWVRSAAPAPWGRPPHTVARSAGRSTRARTRSSRRSVYTRQSKRTWAPSPVSVSVHSPVRVGRRPPRPQRHGRLHARDPRARPHPRASLRRRTPRVRRCAGGPRASANGNCGWVGSGWVRSPCKTCDSTARVVAHCTFSRIVMENVRRSSGGGDESHVLQVSSLHSLRGPHRGELLTLIVHMRRVTPRIERLRNVSATFRCRLSRAAIHRGILRRCDPAISLAQLAAAGTPPRAFAHAPQAGHPTGSFALHGNVIQRSVRRHT